LSKLINFERYQLIPIKASADFSGAVGMAACGKSPWGSWLGFQLIAFFFFDGLRRASGLFSRGDRISKASCEPHEQAETMTAPTSNAT